MTRYCLHDGQQRVHRGWTPRREWMHHHGRGQAELVSNLRVVTYTPLDGH